MNVLVDALMAEARRRGHSVPAEASAATVFSLVREMPYRRATDRQPLTVISEWRGTCSGKHYLLQALLDELGVASDLIACTTHVAADPDLLPDALAAILREGPVPDVHNYLRLPWIVDATWPLAAASYGIPVNPEWTPGRDMLLPCSPLREFAVPADEDPQAFKQDLLQEHFTPRELERRDRFFGLLAGNG